MKIKLKNGSSIFNIFFFIIIYYNEMKKGEIYFIWFLQQLILYIFLSQNYN